MSSVVSETETARRPGWTSVPVLGMLALAVIAAVAGVVLLVGSERSSDDSNTAVIDTRTTAEVIGQVDTALQHILSYQYTDPGATQAAANQVLVGAAKQQFHTLFTALQQKAPGQQLTLSAKVVRSGVSVLDGNRATLLVFLDQTSTRASDGTSATSAAQIHIQAVEQGGVWKISELQPL